MKPVLKAFILADHVYADLDTRKKVIAGTFNRIYADSFPAAFVGPSCVYLSLTDARGQFCITIHYVDLNNDEVLLEAKSNMISADDPLAVIELGIQVPPLPLPHEGEYAFEVYASDEGMTPGNLLAQHKIRVGKRENQGAEQ